MKILKNKTNEEIQKIANNVYSSAEMCRVLNICDNGGNSTRLRMFLKTNGINTEHWTGQLWSKDKTSLNIQLNENIKQQEISNQKYIEKKTQKDLSPIEKAYNIPQFTIQ